MRRTQSVHWWFQPDQNRTIPSPVSLLVVFFTQCDKPSVHWWFQNNFWNAHALLRYRRALSMIFPQAIRRKLVWIPPITSQELTWLAVRIFSPTNLSVVEDEQYLIRKPERCASIPIQPLSTDLPNRPAIQLNLTQSRQQYAAKWKMRHAFWNRKLPPK